MKEPILIFTDGACSGNPGPGGWGTILLIHGQVTELGGFVPGTTNNRMELQAVLEGLQTISNHLNSKDSEVHIYTDSVYVIRGITQWIFAWMRNQWKTKEGEAVLNKDLWMDLFTVVQHLKSKSQLSWLYCRGHVGIPGNERCDEIAVAYSKNLKVNLYRGSAEKYFVDLSHLPEDTSLPEMKGPSGPKKKAFSYLSKVGSIVFRHRDWGSCERRVKGQSGALFKKAMSQAEEVEILKSWGLSESTSIKESEN